MKVIESGVDNSAALAKIERVKEAISRVSYAADDCVDENLISRKTRRLQRLRKKMYDRHNVDPSSLEQAPPSARLTAISLLNEDLRLTEVRYKEAIGMYDQPEREIIFDAGESVNPSDV